MAINYTQPSFSTGNVVDPTRNALAAVTTARQSLSDVLGQSLKQEALQNAQARQKILDDRATAEYNNKLQERNALSKFDKAILAPRQTVYGDVNNSKAMDYIDNIALTPEEMALQKQGKTTPEIEAKLKAQYNFGANFDTNAGVKESEWEKAQRIAKEQGIGDSLAVNKRLYSIKAADAAAKNKKETEALKQKKDLLTQYNKDQSEYNKLLVNKIGHYAGTGSKNSKNGTSYKGDIWTPKAVSDYNEQADKFSPYFSTSWKSVWGNTDAKDARGLATYAQTLGIGPKQLDEILVKYGLGGEEHLLGDEQLTDPTDPNATPEQTLNKIKAELDATNKTNKTTSTGKGTNGGFYSKEDTSYARQNLLNNMKSLQEQMNGIKTDYSTDLTPEERSQKAIETLADKYFKPVINRYGPDKNNVPTKSTKKPSTQRAKDIIGGTIGKAVNSPKGGELAKLVTENPVQFGREYDALDTKDKAKVDKILQSEASKKYFNVLPVNNKQEVSKPKEKINKKPLADGWINTKYGPVYRGGKEYFKGTSTKRLKHLLTKVNGTQKDRILETLKIRGELK